MSRRPVSPRQRDVDALDLLSREQLGIRRHFRDHELLVSRGGDAKQKAASAGRIGDACCLHLRLEDELLYPAACSAQGSDPLLCAAGQHRTHEGKVALGRRQAGGLKLTRTLRCCTPRRWLFVESLSTS